jgi:hypothetical protein
MFLIFKFWGFAMLAPVFVINLISVIAISRFYRSTEEVQEENCNIFGNKWKSMLMVDRINLYNNYSLFTYHYCFQICTEIYPSLFLIILPSNTNNSRWITIFKFISSINFLVIFIELVMITEYFDSYEDEDEVNYGHLYTGASFFFSYLNLLLIYRCVDYYCNCDCLPSREYECSEWQQEEQRSRMNYQPAIGLHQQNNQV